MFFFVFFHDCVGEYKARPSVTHVSELLEIGECSRIDVVTDISNLPPIEIDQQLVHYILRNAYSNALKYGSPLGRVLVRVTLSQSSLRFVVSNAPGPNHEILMAIEDPSVVFEKGVRLHSGIQQAKSNGDGAWIMQRCAIALGGSCAISFLADETAFVLECPIKIHASTNFLKNFELPSSTIIIGVDDSNMQRVALKRMFSSFKNCTIMLYGGVYSEAKNCVDTIIEMLQNFEYCICVLDQNLDYAEGTVLGTSISEKLMASDHKILTFIRSANDSLSDIEYYESHASGHIQKKLMEPMEFKACVFDHFTRKFGVVVHENELNKDPSIDNQHEMYEMYVAEVYPLIDKLKSLSKDVLWRDVWSILHSIKGASAVLNIAESQVIVDEISKYRGEEFPTDWDIVRDRIIGMTTSMLTTIMPLLSEKKSGV